MKVRNLLIAIAGLFGIWGLNVARADQVLYDGTGFVTGTQSFSDGFNLSGPGVLTVTLSNISWPVKLSSLSFVLATAVGTVDTPLSASTGTETFTLDSGQYYALWTGKAQGPMNVGVYGLKIEFQPYAIPTVPLPASSILLLSGLGLLFWWNRRSRVSPDRAPWIPA